MSELTKSQEKLAEALAKGYARDDTPGSMLRVREAQGGVELSLP